eukprot:5389897-Amphidinium_carterae.1
MGYGYDPLTPAATPGMSQGTPSQYFSIATPPHPQKVGGSFGVVPSSVNPLIAQPVDPLVNHDPWG